MAFENKDMEVEGISNGQEAFDRIAEFNPDIVLADVGMQGLDGFELSAKIKETLETSGIKVLLLASDFEEFDEQRYQACGADNHISKPFRSDDIVSMVNSLLEGSSGDEDAALLSDSKIVGQPVEESEIVGQPVEETERAAEISSNLKVSESEEEPSLEELLASVEKLSIAGTEISDLVDEELQVSALQSEDDAIMDQMIRDVEELKESVQSRYPAAEEAEAFPFLGSGADEPEDMGYTDGPKTFAEVGKPRVDNMDELDSAFKELAMGGRPDSTNQEEEHPALSSLGGVVLEPEDLLEDIAPARNRQYESEDDRLTQAIAEEVKHVLKRSLGASRGKEVSGLSDVILKTIHEVVREVTPEIARKAIQEEIEKIKKQGMY